MDGVKWYHALLFIIIAPIWAASQLYKWLRTKIGRK